MQGFVAYAIGAIIVVWRWDDATFVYARADNGHKARSSATVVDGGDGWVSDLALTPDDLYLVSAHDNPHGQVRMQLPLCGPLCRHSPGYYACAVVSCAVGRLWCW